MKQTRRGFLATVAALSALAVAPKAETSGVAPGYTFTQPKQDEWHRVVDGEDRGVAEAGVYIWGEAPFPIRWQRSLHEQT